MFQTHLPPPSPSRYVVADCKITLHVPATSSVMPPRFVVPSKKTDIEDPSALSVAFKTRGIPVHTIVGFDVGLRVAQERTYHEIYLLADRNE